MSRTVGIVVRDERLRRFIAEKIEATGSGILVSDSHIDALNWAKDKRIHVLVLDLHLEGMHGDDVCKDIKSHDYNPKLPIIMLIEEEDEWFRIRCNEAKADTVFAYGQAKEIIEKITQLLAVEFRISTPGAIEYYFVEGSNKTTFKGNVVDVSEKGIAFRAKSCELEREMMVDVKLKLPELQQPIMGRATCMKVRPPGADGIYQVALQWIAYRKGDRERLGAWINQRI